VRVSAYTLYFQKLETLAYIFIAACMGLSSIKFVHWIAFGRSRSFRVIQCRWFWYQSKARIQLPISRSLWLWSYLAHFLRYGDLLAKNCLFLLHFCYSSLIRRPRSQCSLWNFAPKLTVRKLESWGYPPHDRSLSRFGMILACDRGSDGRSDG